MVYYYKIVRRTGLRDSCGSCGAGSAAAALTVPPFQFTIVMIPLGLSLCRNVFAIGEGAFYSVFGKKKIRTVPSASTASMSGSLSNSLIFVPSHPPNQVHVECLSLCLSAASASVVVAVLLSAHIVLSLAFWSAVPTMIHLFCVVQCAHQYSSSQQFVRVELSCRGVHSRPEQQTNNNPHLLLLHRDYHHINVLYLRYVMLLLLTGVWLCARVTLYADRRGAAQYSSCIVSANQPASQPSFYTAPHVSVHS